MSFFSRKPENPTRVTVTFEMVVPNIDVDGAIDETDRKAREHAKKVVEAVQQAVSNLPSPEGSTTTVETEEINMDAAKAAHLVYNRVPLWVVQIISFIAGILVRPVGTPLYTNIHILLAVVGVAYGINLIYGWINKEYPVA